MRVRRYGDARTFLESAEPWLLAAEAENNLLLGVAHQVARGNHPYDEPLYFAIVEDEGGVAGCAFRTPPFKLGLTRMPEGALAALVADVAEVYPDLPAVMGPPSVAEPFADRWSERTGAAAVIGMRQRIYELKEVTPPTSPARGALRRAEPGDMPLLGRWFKAFVEDTHLASATSDRLTDAVLATADLYLWVDEEPRSMAAATGETPNGIRVGAVYTPTEFRRRGYASTCVAELSRLQLEGSRRFCFLYTDLSNPTSNEIYQRIGYQPVCDVVDVNFAHLPNDHPTHEG